MWNEKYSGSILRFNNSCDAFGTAMHKLSLDVIAVLYPEIGDFAEAYNTYAYRNLSPEMLDCINTLWETVKINQLPGQQSHLPLW